MRHLRLVWSKPMNELEEKWEAVRDFYEKYYKVRFEKKLPELKIRELYSKMELVAEELERHHFFLKVK